MQTPSHGTPDDSLFEEELSHPYLQCSCCEKRHEMQGQTPETEERIKQLMSQLETYQVIIKSQKDIFFVLHEMNCDSLIFNFYID